MQSFSPAAAPAPPSDASGVGMASYVLEVAREHAALRSEHEREAATLRQQVADLRAQRDLARNWAIMAQKEAADVKKSMDASQQGFEGLTAKLNDESALHRAKIRSLKAQHAAKVSKLDGELAAQCAALDAAAERERVSTGQLQRTQKELQGLLRQRQRLADTTRLLREVRAENEALKEELRRAEGATLEANTRSARCASQATKLQEEADKWKVAMRQLAEEHHSMMQRGGGGSSEIAMLTRRHREEKQELYAELTQWKERAADVQRLKDFLKTGRERAN